MQNGLEDRQQLVEKFGVLEVDREVLAVDLLHDALSDFSLEVKVVDLLLGFDKLCLLAV